jgi:hypothetical protein
MPLSYGHYGATLPATKKNVTINMTIIARRFNNNDATMIASLMADTVVIRLLWGHTLGNNAYNNQLA